MKTKVLNFVFVGILLSISLISCMEKSSSASSSSNVPDNTKNYENEIKEEAKEIQCAECKGAGMLACTMCDGTGTNNMGMDCGCQTYNHTMIQMGKETDPYQGPYHKCRHCKGTGILSKR